MEAERGRIEGFMVEAFISSAVLGSVWEWGPGLEENGGVYGCWGKSLEVKRGVLRKECAFPFQIAGRLCSGEPL